MLYGRANPYFTFRLCSSANYRHGSSADNRRLNRARSRASEPGRRLLDAFRLGIRSTASDPQELHRPWESKAISVRQLTHHQSLSTDRGAGLPPVACWNMFQVGSNGWAKSAGWADFQDCMCSVGHKQPLRKRKVYLRPIPATSKLGSAQSCLPTENSK